MRRIDELFRDIDSRTDQLEVDIDLSSAPIFAGVQEGLVRLRSMFDELVQEVQRGGGGRDA